jgi:hypothetical protein
MLPTCLTLCAGNVREEARSSSHSFSDVRLVRVGEALSLCSVCRLMDLRSASNHETLPVVRLPSDQAKHKPAKGQCTERKDGLANDTEPAQRLHDTGLENLRRPRVPRAIFDRRPGLPEAKR